MICLLLYLHWNCWIYRSTIIFIHSSSALKPVKLSQVSLKATRDSWAADTRRYLDYSKLSQRILCTMAHHRNLEGHLAVTRVHATPHRPTMGHIWPLATDAIWNWVRLRMRATSLKLFAAFDPLASVAIDILDPLTKGQRGFQYIMVIPVPLLKWSRGSHLDASD